MEQKRVSFKVAKAIKEAGYPQGNTDECYLTADINQIHKMGEIVNDEEREWILITRELADIPTYLDVWPWLCKEKGIRISSEEWHAPHGWGSCIEGNDFYYEIYGYAGPVETVIAAIEYLVDNDLIK